MSAHGVETDTLEGKDSVASVKSKAEMAASESNIESNAVEGS